MKPSRLYRPATGIAIALFVTLSSGCVVAPDGGYAYNNGYPGYYEPYGAYYGGWGPNYLVAPFYIDENERREGRFRGHDEGRGWGGGNPGLHAFRSAPASHGMPSIPSRSRGSRSD